MEKVKKRILSKHQKNRFLLLVLMFIFGAAFMLNIFLIESIVFALLTLLATFGAGLLFVFFDSLYRETKNKLNNKINDKSR
jgi:protein-S-isoprenylcysteine O-methyltransferase Ste14